MAELGIEYLSAGTNKQPAGVDWSFTGVLAFGAGINVALWRPQNSENGGVHQILSGHTKTVTSVMFLRSGVLITGSEDEAIKVWKLEGSAYHCTQTLSESKGSVVSLAVDSTGDPRIFASGSTDYAVRIWELDRQDRATLRQTISALAYFPLALALSPLTSGSAEPKSYILAAAGTKTVIQLYVSDTQSREPNGPAAVDFKLQATLSGHEGWIRSLDFKKESSANSSDLLLSSASQDKYIRLWRIHEGKELPTAAASADPSIGAYMPGKTLSNKAHRFKAQGMDFSATFEALLIGHEDWVFSAKWSKTEALQLLSASADNSLAIWEPEATTGIWRSIARLGGISSEKGSTTATGSTGGFWSGLWSPDGKMVVSHGVTGSWRVWRIDENEQRWKQSPGITGHVRTITGIAWSNDGNYLLSTSLDQTTRLHARWNRTGLSTWHEIARPQIHGYDINCIDSLGPANFVSGAAEKLLRVFTEPKSVAKHLARISGHAGRDLTDLPDAANIPLLGLSNKAVETADTQVEGIADIEPEVDASAISAEISSLPHPPFEEHLSRHTLWPEVEKLYGHGFDISAVSSSHGGSFIATACYASTAEHAVIRLFETKTWHEIKPPLESHSSDVLRLRFSADDGYLLSVGRDRRWTIFQRNDGVYSKVAEEVGAHKRMILDCSWAPTPSRPTFSTVGKDKQVKIWSQTQSISHSPNHEVQSAEGTQLIFHLSSTIREDHIPTAVDFLPQTNKNSLYLAVGFETGLFKIYSLLRDNEASNESEQWAVGQVIGPSSYDHPSKAITQLAWKPSIGNEDGETELAVASEDSSLRVYSFKIST